MTRNKLILAAITLSIAVSLEGQQQSVDVDFTAEEFRQRRDKVFDRIGDNAMALIQGAPSGVGFALFRQSNTFYYLTGLKTPHAYLLMDGRSRKTVAYLPHRNPDYERSVGKILSAEDASTVMRLTGVDEVRGVELLARSLVRAQLRPPPPDLYVPFSPSEGAEASRDELLRYRAGVASDPWDGGDSRQGGFLQRLRDQFPSFELRDLSPILDKLRLVKSPAEISLIRRASRIAGLRSNGGHSEY